MSPAASEPTARSVAERMALRRSEGGWIGTCPLCKRDEALWVGEHVDGSAVIRCSTGCDRHELAAHVMGAHSGCEQMQRRLHSLTAAELLTLELPPRRVILTPWLPEKALGMLYSPRGVGKTFLAVSVGYCIACGSTLLGWRALEPRKVLYLDGEMAATDMKGRFATIVASTEGEPPAPDYFRFLSAGLTEGGLPDLATKDGQREFDAVIGDAAVLILDNISTLCRSGKENEAESWAVVQEWALAQRRAGRTVLFVHHAGKGGAQRGTSKREDVLDTVIALKRPADYRNEQGARFEIHFEKARGFAGADAEPFEARYEVREGAALWTRTSISDADLNRVVNAINDGMSIREAADEFGLHRSKVERLKKKAAAKGLLTADAEGAQSVSPVLAPGAETPETLSKRPRRARRQ